MLTRQMGTKTQEDEGGLEVLIFPCVTSAEPDGFLAADGEGVGS